MSSANLCIPKPEATLRPADAALSPQTSAIAATLHMSAAGTSAVPVVEGKRCLGLLTARAVAAWHATRPSHQKTTVDRLAIAPPILLSVEEFACPDAIFAAAAKLCQHQLGALPLLDEQSCWVGMVTEDELWQDSVQEDWLRLQQVSELALDPIAIAEPEATLAAIAERLVARDARVAAIVDGSGRTVGWLGDRDLVQLAALFGADFARQTAATAMNTLAFAVGPQDSLAVVRQLLVQRYATEVLVTAPTGEPLGVLASRHLLQALDPKELLALTERLHARVAHLETQQIAAEVPATVERKPPACKEAEAAAPERRETRLYAYNNLLSQFVCNLPLQDLFALAIAQAETCLPGGLGSILLVDERGCLSLGAAPSLPQEYNRAIEAAAISVGEDSGPCATAAFRKGPILVEEIATEPRWERFRDLAHQHGLKAVFSFPIMALDGRMFGSFAIYYREVRSPQPDELDFMADITSILAIAIERQRTDAALRESEQRWQFALESAAEGVWDWNLQNQTVFYSRRWKALLGYDEDEIGDALTEWSDRLHPDDRDRCYAELYDYLEGKADRYANEHRLRCKDGSYKWVLDCGVVVERDRAGRPLRAIGTHADITPRKEAQARLEELTMRLTLATEAADLGVWDWDINADRLVWDPAMYALYGVSPAEPTGYDTWERALHPDDRPRAVAAVQAALDGGEDLQLRFRIVRPDGAVRELEAQAIVLRDTDGSAHRLIGVNLDITEREQAQRDATFLATVVRTSEDAIITQSCDGRVSSWNPAAERLFGYAAAEVIGQPLAQFIFPEDRLQEEREIHDRLLRGEKVASYETIRRHKDGTPVDVWIAISPLEDDAGNVIGISKIISDIRGRKRAERLLRESEARFRAIFDNTFQFIGLLSPDGTVIETNQTSLTAGGLERAAVVGRPFWATAWFRDLPAVGTQMREAVTRAARGEFVRFEAEYRDAAGEVRSADFSLRPLYDEAGNVIMLIPEGRDCTEAKCVEAERELYLGSLQASEERLRQAIANAPYPVMLRTEDGEVLQVNDSWTELSGYSAEELPTVSAWLERAYPENPEPAQAAIAATYSSHAPQNYGEFTFRTRDGSRRIWEFSASPLEPLPDGRRVAISMAVDMTERKAAEAALQDLVAGTAATTGPDFFPALVRHITKALGVSHALVAETNSDRARTLAVCIDGELQENLDYGLQDTPCLFTIQEDLYYQEFGISAAFPHNPLRETGVESYLGIALRDRAGREIGTLCILNRQRLPEPKRAEQILRVFGARAAAELERQRAEMALQNLIAGTAATTGGDFFPALVRHLAAVLEVPYVIVSELQGENRLSTLAAWADDAHSGFSFCLLQTPCELVIQNGYYHCNGNLAALFPEDTLLVEMEAESYLGVALYDRQNNPIGNLCILSRQPLPYPERARQIVEVFAARAAAELERQRAELEMERLNSDLERRVAQRTEAVRTREALYRAVMNGSNDLIMLADTQGQFIAANPKVEAFLGYTHDELLAMHITDLHLPQDVPVMMEQFQKMCSGEVPALVWDTDFVRKDGTLFQASASVTTVTIEGQLFLQGAFRDIGPRKRAEAELKKATERLTLALRSGDLGYWEWTIATDELYWDDRLYELHGLPVREELDYATFLATIHRDDVAPLEELVGHALAGTAHENAAGRSQPYEVIYRAVGPQGTISYIKGYGIVLRDDAGEPTGMLGVSINITRFKQAEQQLQIQADEERLLGAVTQRMRAFLDLEGILGATVAELRQVLQCDRVLVYRLDETGMGKAISEAVGDAWPSLLGRSFPGGALQATATGCCQQGCIYPQQNNVGEIPAECFLAYPEGSPMAFPIRAQVAMPIVRQGTIWGLLVAQQCDASRAWQIWETELLKRVADQLAIAIQQAELYAQLQQELQERQTAQQLLVERNQQLAISNEELARATRLKDEFLANMSHELRTPLNAILGLSEGMKEGVNGPLAPEQALALTTIEGSASHLLELIDDILDVAKIEAGRIQLETQGTSIETLCQSSLIFIKQLAHKKRLRVESAIAPDLPQVLLDERRMRQVLINLLSNAVKFTPEGGQITLEVSYQSAEPLQPGRTIALQVRVRDTGIGIAAEQLERLFQPFVQIDSALNRQYAGTGLGLVLVKRIVEMHGGRVEVTSQLGAGSCFAIDLPCEVSALPDSAAKPLPAGPRQEAGEEPTREEKPADTPLILLAEDNEANVLTISGYLQAKGFNLIVASNGHEAVALAQAEASPDLILMDIQMPGMDGFEAIEILRANDRTKTIPIVALTALAMSGDRDRCLAVGANSYLQKPIKLKQLVNEIRSLLHWE